MGRPVKIRNPDEVTNESQVTEVSLMSDEEREKMIDSLKSMGFEDDLTDSSDLYIMTKLREVALAKHAAVSETELKSETEGLEARLKVFSEGSTLKDFVFIDRLMQLGIHKKHVLSLNDVDSKLTDKEIWAKIRRSGIETHQGNSHFSRHFIEPYEPRPEQTIGGNS